MRLRSVIKPPSRYEDETIEGILVKKQQRPQKESEALEEPRETRYSSRRGRSLQIPYIPFNPNLPPAAFPTLDHPRPANEQNLGTKKQGQDQHQEEEDHGVYVLPRTKRSEDYSHVPLRDFDNFLASNGPQNPVWAANMRLMSRKIPSKGLHLDISDSDDDEPPAGEPPALVSDLALALSL